MTLRTKTIEYSFTQNSASLAAAVRFDFGVQTIYIPETTSRTFRSVMLEVSCMDDATASQMSSWLMGIKLGAVAFSDVTTADGANGFPQSSKLQTYIFRRDVTSYFTTNFGAAASQTCQCSLTMTGLATANHNAKLIITYEYDDAATTRIRTVRIPLDSTLVALTNTLAEIGTNQIPNLSTFLPEASIVYRDMFFEVTGNEAPYANSNTGGLALALDAEAEAVDSLHQNGVTTAQWFRRLWKRTDMTTTAVHAFKARFPTVGSYQFEHLAVVLVVTYEYSHSTSTSVMNSIALPLTQQAQPVGCTTSADVNRYAVDFYVEEPATITLKQSGVHLLLDTDDIATHGTFQVGVKCGSQTAQLFNLTGGGTAVGMSTAPSELIFRIDSGGAGGAGITLARGKNTLTLSVYSTSPTTSVRHSLLGAVLYLNYTSAIHANGDGVHNHTTMWMIGDNPTAAAIIRKFTTFKPYISEASYWINGIGACAQIETGNPAQGPISINCEQLAGEGPADGFAQLSNHYHKNSAKIGPRRFYSDWSKFFYRYAADVDTTRLNPATTRVYELQSSVGLSNWLCLYLTYHAITYTIATTGTGTAGAGSALTVNAHRDDTGELIATASSSAGVVTSMTWYDNTVNVFTECREDATHVARSERGLAT